MILLAMLWVGGLFVGIAAFESLPKKVQHELCDWMWR